MHAELSSRKLILPQKGVFSCKKPKLAENIKKLLKLPKRAEISRKQINNKKN